MEGRLFESVPTSTDYVFFVLLSRRHVVENRLLAACVAYTIAQLMRYRNSE